MKIDPNDYNTYRSGVAYRIVRRHKGRINHRDAWELAAVPAFMLWIFRRPYQWFKKRKADRLIRKKLKRSNSNPRSTE